MIQIWSHKNDDVKQMNVSKHNHSLLNYSFLSSKQWDRRTDRCIVGHATDTKTSHNHERFYVTHCRLLYMSQDQQFMLNLDKTAKRSEAILLIRISKNLNALNVWR